MELKIIRNRVEYRNIYAGDCFYYAGNYYMKTRNSAGSSQLAVKLSTGEFEGFTDGGTLVIPVEAVLHLTEIPAPTKEEK